MPDIVAVDRSVTELPVHNPCNKYCVDSYDLFLVEILYVINNMCTVARLVEPAGDQTCTRRCTPVYMTPSLAPPPFPRAPLTPAAGPSHSPNTLELSKRIPDFAPRISFLGRILKK